MSFDPNDFSDVVLPLPDFSSESEDEQGVDPGVAVAAAEPPGANGSIAGALPPPTRPPQERNLVKKEGIVLAIAPALGVSLEELFAAVTATATHGGRQLLDASSQLAASSAGALQAGASKHITWTFHNSWGVAQVAGSGSGGDGGADDDDGPRAPEGVEELLLATCVVKDSSAGASQDDAGGDGELLASVLNLTEVCVKRFACLLPACYVYKWMLRVRSPSRTVPFATMV